MKYSIEYAHTYTDDNFGPEQQESIDILLEEENRIHREGNKSIRCVLIDNYNPRKKLLDLKKFEKELVQNNAKPDFLVYEGDLQELAMELIDKTKNRIHNEYTKYINNAHGHIPCSLFIATWYLLRLGILKIDGKNMTADHLVNILPERFKYVEKKGILILKSSPYIDIVDRITNIYF